MIYLEEYRKLLDITNEEAIKCGVSLVSVLGASRTRGVVRARWNAIGRMKRELPLSTTEIGYFFRRDHSTILHALKNA